MRAVAAIPVLLSVVALILSLLCLFAGSSKGFMEDYSIVTLNTSRIGQNLLNDSSSTSSSSSNGSFWSHLTSDISNEIQSLENDIDDALSSAIASIAQDLGLHDFYSMHLLDFCEGFYTPGPVPNATLARSHISQNVTRCSNRTGMAHFDPRATLQQELRNSSLADYVNLTSLAWPEAIDHGLHALHAATNAMFVLYCLGIAFVGLALIAAVVAVFATGTLMVLANWILDVLAFLCLAIASAISTAVGVKVAHLVNHYGADIGVSAQRGNRFIAMTWAATAVMFLATFVWCFICVQDRRRGPRSSRKTAYNG